MSRSLKTFYWYVDIYFIIVTGFDIYGIYRGIHYHKPWMMITSVVATIVMIVLYIFYYTGKIRHNKKMKELNDQIEEMEKKIFENKLN